MKKFKTSEDLDELSVSLPLNKARDILTMCYRGAEDALRVLLKAKDNNIVLGKLQQTALQAYVDDYKFLRDAIAECIGTQVSQEDQRAIKAHEDGNRAKLHKELTDLYPGRIDDAHACSDPECTSCEHIRDSFNKKTVEEEFDVSDLPEGTFIVPGSDEEN